MGEINKIGGSGLLLASGLLAKETVIWAWGWILDRLAGEKPLMDWSKIDWSNTLACLCLMGSAIAFSWPYLLRIRDWWRSPSAKFTAQFAIADCDSKFDALITALRDRDKKVDNEISVTRALAAGEVADLKARLERLENSL